MQAADRKIMRMSGEFFTRLKLNRPLFKHEKLTFTCFMVAVISLLFFSCSDKYLAFKDRYNFISADGRPDYSDLHYWAAHPWKWDPSDSIPAPLRQEKRDSAADVFFLHPTMYTMKMRLNKMNADIDDDYINAKTDYSTILYQASVFNKHARIFAPRFREAHISAYFIKDTAKAKAAFNVAYEDVKSAFEYFLTHYNNGRPIIIASHSQGTTHALRLLKEYFENKPLQEKLVAAYVVGMTLPKDLFSSLKMCEDENQTGCLCGWRTFRKGFRSSYVKKEMGNSFVTNPLTWKTNEVYASRMMNKGSVLYKFNKIYKGTTDAQVNTDVLWVKKPKFPWSFLYFARNYHAGDINLFYMNIRENAFLRISSYFKKHQQP
jgi:hypothetical protein